MPGQLRVGVLISGRGSNMVALAEACAAPDSPARIVVVLSNKADAAGLDFARQAGIPTVVIRHGDYPDRGSFERALTAALEDAGVELVCLAGFMRVLTPVFVDHWQGRTLNVHPSLLPKYPGLDTHARAIAAGDPEAGCTIHIVTREVDGGPIVVQERVPILPGDTPDTLAARVLAAEHRAYPLALFKVARGRLAGAGQAV
ncbi:MAG: phosphoribosylglycinamide formyltransferase [Alphaproteobacteria bacterium]